MLVVTLLACATPAPASLEGAERLPATGRLEGQPPGAALRLGGALGSLSRTPNPGTPPDLAMGGARVQVAPTSGTLSFTWESQAGPTWTVTCQDTLGVSPNPLPNGENPRGLRLDCTLGSESVTWRLEVEAVGDQPAAGQLLRDGGPRYALLETDIAPFQRTGPRQASWSLSLEGRSLALIELRGEGALHLHPELADPEPVTLAANALLLWHDPR